MRVTFYFPSPSTLYNAACHPLDTLFALAKKVLETIASLFIGHRAPEPSSFHYHHIEDLPSCLISCISSLMKPSLDTQQAITILISAIDSLPDYDQRYYSLHKLADVFEQQNLNERALDIRNLAGTECDFLLDHATISNVFDTEPIDRAENLISTGQYIQEGFSILMEIIESAEDKEIKFFYLYLMLALWAMYFEKIRDEEINPFLEKIDNALNVLTDIEYQESLIWISQYLLSKKSNTTLNTFLKD
jgi:hypothetical protein